MLALLIRFLLALRSVSEARASREAEILVLRQQLLVLSRKSRKRVRLRNIDRLILVWLSRLYPSLLDAIIIVKPETLLRWHRRGFRAYWRWKSWHGDKAEDRSRTPGTNRAHEHGESDVGSTADPWGELLMLDIDVSESTVGRYMIRIGRPRSQGWKTFLASAPRPRQRVRHRVHSAHPCDGYSRSPSRRALVLAERTRGAADRLDPARMPWWCRTRGTWVEFSKPTPPTTIRSGPIWR
ncbi:MAG: Integrase, catalytic region [Candidatus Binatus sp.]|nr:Integrase, catalytic region [Candidatus Binatus sp.]